jgi:hypothetical protein
VYGTVGRMQVKPGKMQELVALMSNPEGATARGFRSSAILVADDGNEAVVTVLFDDKESYFEMVHDPKTDENFGKIMGLLEDEPAWTDGEWHTTVS